LLFQNSPPGWRKFLGIGETLDWVVRVEHDRRGDNRSRKGPAPGFVYTGDKLRNWEFMHI
jgi:hypothetical protein